MPIGTDAKEPMTDNRAKPSSRDKSLMICDRMAKVARDLRDAAANGEASGDGRLLEIAESLGRLADERRREICGKTPPHMAQAERKAATR